VVTVAGGRSVEVVEVSPLHMRGFYPSDAGADMQCSADTQ
jgi:hypothetical protein